MASRILGQTPHYSCLEVERVSHPTSLRADPHLAVTEKLIRVGQDWGQAPTLPLALLMTLSPNKTHAGVFSLMSRERSSIIISELGSSSFLTSKKKNKIKIKQNETRKLRAGGNM